MTDRYTKTVLTIIAVALVWIAINHHASASQASMNDLSDQIASVGSAVGDVQDKLDSVASDVADIKAAQQQQQ